MRILVALLILAASSAAQAEWMLIQQTGQRPHRVAVFADADSLTDPSLGLRYTQAVLANDKKAQDAITDAGRRYRTVRLIEVYERAAEPETRYTTVEVDGDLHVFRTLAARDFRHDASFVDRPTPGWRKLDAAPWGPAVEKYAFSEDRWRKAVSALKQRVRESGGTSSDQRELEPFGYELVVGQSHAALPDLMWKYFWMDGTRPPVDEPMLTPAKIGYAIDLENREMKGRMRLLSDVEGKLKERVSEQRSRSSAAGTVDNSLFGSWIDAPEAELVANWGEPHRFTESNGVRYLTWRQERVVDILRQNQGPTVMKIGEEIYWSEVTFLVSGGKIFNYTTDGNEMW